MRGLSLLRRLCLPPFQQTSSTKDIRLTHHSRVRSASPRFFLSLSSSARDQTSCAQVASRDRQRQCRWIPEAVLDQRFVSFFSLFLFTFLFFLPLLFGWASDGGWRPFPHGGPTVGEPGNWRTLSPFTFDGEESWRERGEHAGRSALELGRVGGSHLEPARELESIPWLL